MDLLKISKEAKNWFALKTRFLMNQFSGGVVMFFALKIMGIVLGCYIAIRGSGIGLAWLKEFFDELMPHKRE